MIWTGFDYIKMIGDADVYSGAKYIMGHRKLTNSINNKKMHIAIDGFLINKPRGLGRYVQELLFALSHHPILDVTVTVLVPFLPSQDFQSKFPNIRFKKLFSVPFPIWEQVVLPWEIWFGKYDFIHFPYNTKPLLMNVLHKEHLVTLHDLTFYNETGSNFYQFLGSKYRKWVVRLGINKNTRLVTDSEASRQDIKNLLSCESKVVHISVELFLDEINAMGDMERRPEISPYFVHIGGVSPHKNTAMVIDAFKQANIQGVKLIVLGMPASSSLAEKEISDNIVFPGWIDNLEVVFLIKNAIGMVFPSLREGYGLPIVEAFAFACPVITSNIPPMSELALDAAILVDPNNLQELSQAMMNLYSNNELREQLKAKSIKRFKDFSSEAMAHKMYEIYLRGFDCGSVA